MLSCRAGGLTKSYGQSRDTFISYFIFFFHLFPRRFRCLGDAQWTTLKCSHSFFSTCFLLYNNSNNNNTTKEFELAEGNGSVEGVALMNNPSFFFISLLLYSIAIRYLPRKEWVG